MTMLLSDTVLVAAISAVVAVVTQVVALIVALRTSKKVDNVAKATNGMKDALVEASRGEAAALGRRQGIEAERERGAGVQDALVTAVRNEATAVGRSEGMAAERDRQERR